MSLKIPTKHRTAAQHRSKLLHKERLLGHNSSLNICRNFISAKLSSKSTSGYSLCHNFKRFDPVFFFTKVSIAICILMIHGSSNSRASTGNSHISNQAIHCLPIRLPCFSKWRHQAWLGTPSYNTLPMFNVNYYPKVPAVFAKYYK